MSPAPAPSRPGHAALPPRALADLGRRTLIMGILNVTPNSFSDGGVYRDEDAAVERASEMAAEGADIIDIGGESTRPGTAPVDAEEEQARALPVLKRVAAARAIPVSIDTYRASTARLAFEAGAAILNDVWGLQREPEIAYVAADRDAPTIIMHNREKADGAIDILEDMRAFFARSLMIARHAGLRDENIVLDPGIGFGKTREQSLHALREIAILKEFGFPILAGLSRKSFLAPYYPEGTPPAGRLMATIAANAYAVEAGAAIIRVHDVKPHVEAIAVIDALTRASA
ncbi:dihydropteroate synthase [Terrirubrum flagellatum]|uniref:dihydropteroate synthase n=1 Tax=Terrirubrum flagellatum TaxID=2895980 RepID=UPI003CC811D1